MFLRKKLPKPWTQFAFIIAMFVIVKGSILKLISVALFTVGIMYYSR